MFTDQDLEDDSNAAVTKEQKKTITKSNQQNGTKIIDETVKLNKEKQTTVQTIKIGTWQIIYQVDF